MKITVLAVDSKIIANKPTKIGVLITTGTLINQHVGVQGILPVPEQRELNATMTRAIFQSRTVNVITYRPIHLRRRQQKHQPLIQEIVAATKEEKSVNGPRKGVVMSGCTKKKRDFVPLVTLQ